MLIKLNEVIDVLNADLMVPCFQPIADLRTWDLLGFEVLARYKHPRLGLILPNNFIQLAEDHGLMDQLTDQVFRKAFTRGAELPSRFRLSLNVSPLQMRRANLPGLLRRAAEEGGFSLKRVTIEITESALLGELEQTQSIARELKEMGCKLSLDDFGTGAASLFHLQSLPFDELKVDQSFTAGMTMKRGSRKIAAAIVGLGGTLGLTTIAEGIETKEQAEMMLRLGCDAGQGWLFGRPVSSEKLQTLVNQPRLYARERREPLEIPVSCLEALPTQRLAQLQAIYDGAPVGLCFLDKELRYVSINERLAEMNGRSVASHLGRSLEELYPEWVEKFKPMLSRALAGESITSVKISRPSLRPGEQGLDLLVSYHPAWDEADEVIGVSVSALDITKSKPEEAASYWEAYNKDFIRKNTFSPWVTRKERQTPWPNSHELEPTVSKELNLSEAYPEILGALPFQLIKTEICAAAGPLVQAEHQLSVVEDSGRAEEVRASSSSIEPVANRRPARTRSGLRALDLKFWRGREPLHLLETTDAMLP